MIRAAFRAVARRWRAVAVLLLLTALFAFTAWYQYRKEPRGAPTIADAAFVAAANKLCAASIPPLRATRSTTDTNDNLETQTAAAVDRADDGLAAVLASLRALPVRTEDQPAVAAWLAHWDDYLAVGHRYAAALRSGDPRRYSRIDDAGVPANNAIARFSRANRIDACIP